MKKSRNHKNVKVVIIAAICLAFVIGIGAGLGAGKYFLDNKEQKTQAKTENAKPGDSSQSGSDEVKGNAAAKDDGKTQGTDAKPNDSTNSDSTGDGSLKEDGSKGSAAEKENDDSKGNTQNSDSNDQPQGSESSTYDASAPTDDTKIHRYELIISDVTWQEAFADCINRGGYLARINSSKEYEAVRKEISRQKMTNIYFRIGGRRDSQSKDYYWVNEDNRLFGEKLNSDSSWCSDEWMKGEPSFQDGDLEERYMDLFFFDGEKRFVWNDVPDDMLAAEPAYTGKLGYICEYED